MPIDTPLDEDVLDEEGDRQHVHHGADLLALLRPAEQVDDHVRDDAEIHAFGDAVGEGHRDGADERGDTLGDVAEVHPEEGAHHREAHHDQGRRRSEDGDRQEERREQEGEQEEGCRHQGREARTAAFRDTCGALDGDAGRRDAERRGEHRGDRLRDECPLGLLEAAVALEEVRLRGEPQDGADGVEQRGEQDREDDGHETDLGDVREIELEQDRGQRRDRDPVREVGNQAGIARIRLGDVDAGELADEPEPPGDEDAQKDAPLDALRHEHRHHQDADKGKDGRDAGCGERPLGGARMEVDHAYQRRRIAHDDTGTLEADKCDEEPDAGRDGELEARRDCIDHHVAELGEREEQEDDALHEHRGKRGLPAVPHIEHHGVGEIRVEAEARCQDEGVVRGQRHDAGADEGRQGRRREDRPAVKACRREYAGVDRQDVGDGDECRHTSNDLGLHRRSPLLEMEPPLDCLFHTNLSFQRLSSCMRDVLHTPPLPFHAPCVGGAHHALGVAASSPTIPLTKLTAFSTAFMTSW